MDLYASPMACSLASHITALEAGLPVKLHYVNTATKKTDDGGDYLKISPHGYVPALRLPSGQILNEGASVLQYLADQKPEAKLAPAWGSVERYELIDVLHYMATEMHKHIFHALLTPSVAEATKAEAKKALEPALNHIAARIGKRDFLVGNHFTVADAYLFVMLNWAAYLGTDLKKWPTIAAYHQRIMARPHVARAMGEEMNERKRRAA